MVILSSPSGAGKTTISKKFSKNINRLKFQSHTTRKPRKNEIDGIDYHFISKDKFKELIKERKFYEYAEIFGNYYGTLKENVDKIILENDILFDIDWQGTQQLSKFPNLNLIKIYLILQVKKNLNQD